MTVVPCSLTGPLPYRMSDARPRDDEGVWVPMHDIVPEGSHPEKDLPPLEESRPSDPTAQSTPRTVSTSLVMWYIFLRVCEQLKAVAPISLFLISFRVLVFGQSVVGLPSITLGLSIVVVGLTLFIEGSFLRGISSLSIYLSIYLSFMHAYNPSPLWFFF